MVTEKCFRRRKASLHISVDADLSKRLRYVSEKMSIPLSHLTSLAISRAVRDYESELGITSTKGEQP
jgi:post-segregation antitoxin (ccd killing protein)